MIFISSYNSARLVITNMVHDKLHQVKSLLDTNINTLLQDLDASQGYDKLSRLDVDEPDTEETLQHIQSAVARLNAQRRQHLASIFTHQAVSHIILQYFDAEKLSNRLSISLIQPQDILGSAEDYYYDRYSVLPTPKLIRYSQILLDSGKVNSAKERDCMLR